MLNRRTFWRLGAVFALIYFFSPNGLAALPNLSVSFLLKDVLRMTAEQASYFGSITIIGWAVKPVWGILSDAFPLFGYRRVSYLTAATLGAALVWTALGFLNNYSVGALLVLFSLSSLFYSFMDVLCDALMVEAGQEHGLTGKFQSIQWTAVYVASTITSLAGGYIAAHWEPAEVFMLNAAFPLVILSAVLLFVRERRVAAAAVPAAPEPARRGFAPLFAPHRAAAENPDRASLQTAHTAFSTIRETFRARQTWFLALFIFFVAFSPSFGAPFFYYAVDTLKFTPVFLGVAGSIGAASAAIGAILFGKFSLRFRTRPLIRNLLIFFTLFTLADLAYFLPYVTAHLSFARYLYGATAAVGGAAGALVFLAILNSAALAAPKGGEGGVFATLTAFWNVGLMGSSALGGYLFGMVGLPPLIVVSAVFTGAALLFLPRLRFADEVPAHSLRVQP